MPSRRILVSHFRVIIARLWLHGTLPYRRITRPPGAQTSMGSNHTLSKQLSTRLIECTSRLRQECGLELERLGSSLLLQKLIGAAISQPSCQKSRRKENIIYSILEASLIKLIFLINILTDAIIENFHIFKNIFPYQKQDQSLN